VTYDLGRKAIIDLDSIEAQLIADCMESNMSLCTTLLVVNKHQMEMEEPSFTIHPIQRTVKALKPKYQRVGKTSQRSKDPAAPWPRARVNWCKQILIRMGRRPSEPGLDHFDKSKMPTLTPEQIGWWDETQRKCVIGGMAKNSTGDDVRNCVKFPRDINGNIDLVNGTYSEEHNSELKVKFEQEIRLCLGCAVVEKGNEVRGVRLLSFDYSGKTILTIKGWNARANTEIRHVKNLSSTTL
jgi:hypothetical protein